jgi:hypothetical protein
VSENDDRSTYWKYIFRIIFECYKKLWIIRALFSEYVTVEL